MFESFRLVEGNGIYPAQRINYANQGNFVIGLGGMGIQSMRYLRNRVYEGITYDAADPEYGPDDISIRFLAIDTDSDIRRIPELRECERFFIPRIPGFPETHEDHCRAIRESFHMAQNALMSCFMRQCSPLIMQYGSVDIHIIAGMCGFTGGILINELCEFIRWNVHDSRIHVYTFQPDTFCRYYPVNHPQRLQMEAMGQEALLQLNKSFIHSCMILTDPSVPAELGNPTCLSEYIADVIRVNLLIPAMQFGLQPKAIPGVIGLVSSEAVRYPIREVYTNIFSRSFMDAQRFLERTDSDFVHNTEFREILKELQLDNVRTLGSVIFNQFKKSRYNELPAVIQQLYQAQDSSYQIRNLKYQYSGEIQRECEELYRSSFLENLKKHMLDSLDQTLGMSISSAGFQGMLINGTFHQALRYVFQCLDEEIQNSLRRIEVYLSSIEKQLDSLLNDFDDASPFTRTLKKRRFCEEISELLERYLHTVQMRYTYKLQLDAYMHLKKEADDWYVRKALPIHKSIGELINISIDNMDYLNSRRKTEVLLDQSIYCFDRLLPARVSANDLKSIIRILAETMKEQEGQLPSFEARRRILVYVEQEIGDAIPRSLHAFVQTLAQEFNTALFSAELTARCNALDHLTVPMNNYPANALTAVHHFYAEAVNSPGSVLMRPMNFLAGASLSQRIDREDELVHIMIQDILL